MVAAKLSCSGTVYGGSTIKHSRRWAISREFRGFLARGQRIAEFGHGRYSLSLDHTKGLLSSPIVRQRKPIFSRFDCTVSSDSGLQSYNAEESSVVEEEIFHESSSLLNEPNGVVSSGINETNNKSREVPAGTSQSRKVVPELINLSAPAFLGQLIEPQVQWMESACIGRLGYMELASAGVSMQLFNTISKLFNIPLLSVATSFVAEDVSKNASRLLAEDEKEGPREKSLTIVKERLQLSSVSTALLLAVGIGIFEAVVLSLGSGQLLGLMGTPQASPMHAPARRYLILRALGAPAYVASLALQGIFRGLKDTKTPTYCLGFGSFTAIILFPLLVFYCELGVSGAAIATVMSQYFIAFAMIWFLSKRVVLLPPKLGQLQFGGYLKSGGFLIGRTLSVLMTLTIGTSMAARQGPTAMAAHQIFMQVWLPVSLLTDALGASAQALVASYISKDDYRTAKDVAHLVLTAGFVSGVVLAVILGVSFSFLATLFTKDAEVLKIARAGVLFVSASQPLNALAFVFDGLHYGVSDFPYAARSMMLVGAISSAFLLCAPMVFGLPGVWTGLSLFMGLRMTAGIIRLMSKEGPWWFLHGDVNKATDCCLRI